MCSYRTGSYCSGCIECRTNPAEEEEIAYRGYWIVRPINPPIWQWDGCEIIDAEGYQVTDAQNVRHAETIIDGLLEAKG